MPSIQTYQLPDGLPLALPVCSRELHARLLAARGFLYLITQELHSGGSAAALDEPGPSQARGMRCPVHCGTMGCLVGRRATGAASDEKPAAIANRRRPSYPMKQPIYCHSIGRPAGHHEPAERAQRRRRRWGHAAARGHVLPAALPHTGEDQLAVLASVLLQPGSAALLAAANAPL